MPAVSGSGAEWSLDASITWMVDTDRRGVEPRLASDGRHRGDRRPDCSRQAQRWRREQEPAPPVVAEPCRELVQIPHLTERDAEPEETQVVDRQERVAARIAVLAEQSLDGVVVSHER